MLVVNDQISITPNEIQWQAVRSQGAGGQNVNKVSSAVHLRFDIPASSLPETIKTRLLNLNDKRITKDGVLVIKAQQYRHQEKNYDDALERLADIIRDAARVQKPRRPTPPSRSSVKKRLESKTRHARLKAARGKVGFDD